MSTSSFYDTDIYSYANDFVLKKSYLILERHRKSSLYSAGSLPSRNILPFLLTASAL